MFQVAFGTLVQLMLEGDEAEFKRVLAFNKVCGGSAACAGAA
jgi:glycerol dehydrogenase-like iron-containing ADH family enzyme